MLKRFIITTLMFSVALPVFAQTNSGEGSVRKDTMRVQPVRAEVTLPVPELRAEIQGDVRMERGEMERDEKDRMERDRMERERMEQCDDSVEDCAVALDDSGNERSAMEQERREKEDMLRTEMQDRAAAIRMEFNASKEERQEQIETLREEMKTKREEIRVEIKTKREEWKDQKKAESVNRLDIAFNDINIRVTDSLLKLLEKMESVLARVDEAAVKAGDEGKDVSAVTTAVAAARVSIGTATEAVTAQAGMDYTITVEDETQAREAVEAMKQQLRSDLASTRETVRSVQPLVREAVVALKTVLAGTVSVEVEAETQTQ